MSDRKGKSSPTLVLVSAAPVPTLDAVLASPEPPGKLFGVIFLCVPDDRSYKSKKSLAPSGDASIVNVFISRSKVISLAFWAWLSPSPPIIDLKGRSTPDLVVNT